MNIKQILRVVSVLLFTIAFFMFFPFFIALYYNEKDIFLSFLIPICAILIVCSLTLFITRKNIKNTISTRDGFLVVSLSWISAEVPLVGRGHIHAHDVAHRKVGLHVEVRHRHIVLDGHHGRGRVVGGDRLSRHGGGAGGQRDDAGWYDRAGAPGDLCSTPGAGRGGGFLTVIQPR